ncbi:MAG: hypothetical protein E3J21_19810 [Anaerolineales bacterium]|nr:MAG: hypothetical protein E3J21_19810 [Anaerolineales bacterium]
MSFRKMSFRKRVLLVGCVSLLAMAGLVIMLIMLGLAIGGGAVVAHSQPTPTPTKTPRPTLAATSTPTPVCLATATPLPTDTLALSPAAASVPTGPPTDTPIPSGVTMPSPTDTPAPADTLIETPTPTGTLTDTPTPSPTPTPTPTPVPPSRITGRLLLDGAPVSGGATLKLENQSYNVIAETTVGADGAYAFTDLEPSSQGYNVLFAQAWNSQYGTDQVVSWGWLGPVSVENGTVVELPDFDVSLLGFSQVNPGPDETFSAAALSPENPITFEWTAYPQAVKYWMDLVRGEAQELVWQSLIQSTSFAFDGTMGNGAHIQPGEYWWGVGARRELGPYPLTVYGYLPGLIIEP